MWQTVEPILFTIVGGIIVGGFVIIFLILLYWASRHIFNGKNWDRG